MPALGWRLLLVLGVGLVVACDDDDDDNPIAPETEILSLTYGGTAVVAPGGRCPALTATINFSGEADPGGAFVANQSHCVDPANPGITTDGQFTWSFPNGNAISGTYESVLTPAADPAFRNIDADLTITSGEGEFEGASGRAEVIGSFNIQTLATTLRAVAAFTH